MQIIHEKPNRFGHVDPENRMREDELKDSAVLKTQEVVGTQECQSKPAEDKQD